jgi:hypothetical protein
MHITDTKTRILVAAQLAAALVGRRDYPGAGSNGEPTHADAIKTYHAIERQLAGAEKESPGASG